MEPLSGPDLLLRSAGGSRRLDSGKAGTLWPSPTQMALAMPAWASQPAFQGRRALSPGPPSRLVRHHHGEAPTGPAVFGQHRLEGLLLALGPRPRHVGVWARGRAWGILGLGSAPRRRAEPEPALPCRVRAPFSASSFSPAEEQLLSQCADRETEAQRGNHS